MAIEWLICHHYSNTFETLMISRIERDLNGSNNRGPLGKRIQGVLDVLKIRRIKRQKNLTIFLLPKDTEYRHIILHRIHQDTYI